MSYYSSTFYGLATNTEMDVLGWTPSSHTPALLRFKIGQDAQLDRDSCTSIAVAPGANAHFMRHTGLVLGTNENCTALIRVNRYSGGQYNHNIDFYIANAATRTQGVTVKLWRAATGDNQFCVDIDIIGGVADPAPVTGLQDPFSWLTKIETTWSNATTLVIKVHAFQANGTFTQVHTRTVTGTATSGLVGMYSLNGSVGKAYIGCFKAATGTASWAMLTRPFCNQTPFARAVSGDEAFTLKGICGNVANGETIQAKFVPEGTADGSVSWQDIVTLTAGTESWSGTVTAPSATNLYGKFLVRTSGSPSATDQIEHCPVLWLFAGGGQSNTGRATNRQVFTPANGIDELWCWPSKIPSPTGDPSVAQYWRTLTTEVTASGGEQVVYNASNGTPWPIVASEIASILSDRVAFIFWGLGSTGLVGGGTWAGGGAEFVRLVVNFQASGITKVNGFIWVQGENEVQNSVTQAQYASAFVTMINDIEAEIGFSLATVFFYTLGYENYGTIISDVDAANKMAPILAAQLQLADLRPDSNQGGFVRHVDLSTGAGGDNVHFQSDTNVAIFGQQYGRAIVDHFFPNLNVGGPRLSVCLWNEMHSSINVVFDENIAFAGTGFFTGFRVEVNGSAVAYTTSSISGATITITLATPTSDGDTIVIYYPNGNDVTDGSSESNLYIADASTGTRPAFAFVEEPTIGAESGKRLRFRMRQRLLMGVR